MPENEFTFRVLRPEELQLTSQYRVLARLPAYHPLVHGGWVQLGLPDAAVRESQDRVSTALNSSGFKFSYGRTTINLAPADVKKEGPSFDLPIAIGMLAITCHARLSDR